MRDPSAAARGDHPASAPSRDECPSSLLVVAGVSGSGKSTVGEALGSRLGLPYRDADGFHPQANVDKMRAGHALTDADRRPWLDAIGAWLAGRGVAGAVVSCSALSRAHRDRLRRQATGAAFMLLAGPREAVQRRLDTRRGHFMPASLLASQYDALEPLQPDEPGVILDLDRPVAAIVDEIVAWLQQPAS